MDLDAILRQPFRWPKAGDKLFAPAAEWHGNAVIAHHPDSRLVLMMTGYKKAGDVLVREAMDDRAVRDVLVFPIIFNYRQFIELSLKYILSAYGPSVGIAAIWDSHSLAKLWAEVLKVFEGYGARDGDGTEQAVGELIAEFDKVDPRSFAYRYPVDTRGHPTDIAFEQVDLSALADVIGGLDGFFTGCDGYLDRMRSAGP